MSISTLERRRIPTLNGVVRWYTIQPPDWLGGKNMLIKSGKWDFPEHGRTFEEKMRSIYDFLSILFRCLFCIV